LFEQPDGFDAGQDVHVHIKQDDINTAIGDDFDGLFARFCFVKAQERSVLENFAEHASEGCVIVGNQQVECFLIMLKHVVGRPQRWFDSLKHPAHPAAL
jgi:hypothetical protein